MIFPNCSFMVTMPEEEAFKGKHLFVIGMGYLGTRVARQAIERGMRVSGLTRTPDKAERLSSEGVGMVVGDLLEQDWHARISRPVDFILNCVSAGGGGVQGYRQTYVHGMQSLVNYCASDFAGRLIYTSSTGVYPFSDGEWVAEDTLFEPQTEASSLLLEAENFLQEKGPDGWAILRLSGIYGPGRHYLLNQVLSAESELPGEGGVYFNLIRVEDICSAIWSVWKADVPVLNTIYNVTDDEPALKREVVAWLAEKTGKPTPGFNPARSIRQRSLPNGKLPNRMISNARLKQATAWKPEFPTFREGFADLIRR